MGESTSQYFAMPTMSCPGVREVDGALPGHYTEDVKREQDSGAGVEFSIRLFTR